MLSSAACLSTASQVMAGAGSKFSMSGRRGLVGSVAGGATCGTGARLWLSACGAEDESEAGTPEVGPRAGGDQGLGLGFQLGDGANEKGTIGGTADGALTTGGAFACGPNENGVKVKGAGDDEGGAVLAAGAWGVNWNGMVGENTGGANVWVPEGEGEIVVRLGLGEKIEWACGGTAGADTSENGVKGV